MKFVSRSDKYLLEIGETVKNAMTNHAGFSGFGPYAAAVFWGIGLVFHFLGVFGPTFLFGKDWENKKIEEYMEKERKHWE